MTVDTRHPILRQLSRAQRALLQAQAEHEAACAANAELRARYASSGRSTTIKHSWGVSSMPRDLRDARARQTEATKRLNQAKADRAYWATAWDARRLDFAEWSAAVKQADRARSGHFHENQYPPRQAAATLRSMARRLVSAVEWLDDIDQLASDLGHYATDTGIQPDPERLRTVLSRASQAEASIVQALRQLAGYQPFPAGDDAESDSAALFLHDRDDAITSEVSPSADSI